VWWKSSEGLVGWFVGGSGEGEGGSGLACLWFMADHVFFILINSIKRRINSTFIEKNIILL
jgi:hypothetical protein